MRAAVIEGPDQVAVRDVPDPTPAADEVVVAVAGCGICGTDVHLVEGVLPGARYPLVPGHEFYGRVVHTVDGGPPTGSLVAVDPNLPCGACPPCRNGRSNLCENYSAIGVTRDGACAEYVAAPAGVCRLLPDGFRLDAAALIEPMSCVIHGVDRVPAQPRSARWVVYGAGTVGTLMADAAAPLTDHEVSVVEPNPDRRSRAGALGFRAAASADEFPVAEFDVVIDCTGVPAAISDGLGRIATGGAMLLFGVASPNAVVDLSPYDVYRREITIVGSMAVHRSFDRAITAISERPAVAAALVTHRISLADYPSALEVFRSGGSGKVEIVASS